MRQNQTRVAWGDAGVTPHSSTCAQATSAFMTHSLPSPRNTHGFLNSILRARQVGFQSGLELTVCLWTSDLTFPSLCFLIFKRG